jgi:hypothetical protein
MDVASFLERKRDELLASAEEAVARAHLPHYDDGERSHARLGVLLDLVVGACRDHRLDGVNAYADSLAVQRQAGGFALAEVQTAVNVLEEVIWRTLTAQAPPEVQAYALGLVSTALGAVKDRVACGYLAQLTARPVPSLRVHLLFDGTDSITPVS